jgi:RES domain-containing protein
MVYCATSPALAALEAFVHLSPAQRVIGKMPKLRLLEFIVPDDVVRRHDMPPTMTFDQKSVGDGFLQHNLSVGILVPSMVIPQDQNVLLNPLHPDFARSVKLSADHDFQYDPRLATLG